MADSNPFDQFDASPAPATASQPGAAPGFHYDPAHRQMVPSGQPYTQSTPQGNPFDQFDSPDMHPVGAQKTADLYRDLTPPPRSGAADIGHGIGMGLVKGAGSVLGLPSDLWQMMDRGYQNIMTRGAEKIGLLTPEQGAALRQPIPEAEDYEAGSQKINQHLMGLAKSAGADTSEPSTRAGQAAENVASFVPGAISLGASSAKEIPKAALRYGLIPGATSEAAGEATEGTPLEPAARVAGAVLGSPGAITGTARAVTSGLGRAGDMVAPQTTAAIRGAVNPVGTMLDGLSNADARAAQQLVTESRAAGAPLTLPEAIQKVTGGATRAGDIQRVVEQSPEGAAVMRPFMAQRPAQTQALGRAAFDQIAPSGTDPYQIAPRIQGAAQQVLDTSPQAAHLNQSVTSLGPRTTAEEAGNIIQPELRSVYERRGGMRNALADQDYASARNAPVPGPPEIVPRQPIVSPPTFMPPGASVPPGPRINALISEDERLAATRPSEIPPGAPQPPNPLSTEPGTIPHAVEYGEARAGQVNVNPVIDHIDDLLTSAKGAPAGALRTARRALFSNGQPDMSVRGLSNARNAISDQISSASRAGNNQVASVLEGVQGKLDAALEDVPAYGQARQNFARASEPLAPFADNTAPGRIIDQFNRGFTMPAERVAPSIERGGPSSADQFLSAAENSPASRQAFGQYYSQQLLGTATDATGRINPDILANTLRDNQDMLQRFPEIANNLSRVGGARRALQQLEETPTGALAATAGKTGQEQFAAQRNLLFASNPLAGSERTIGNTVRAIAEHDPVAAQQFVRQHLEQAFNEATQNNLAGPNQFGGPKFAAVAFGNPQQAKNTEAAVRALPDGNLRWNALRKGMDIMEGMGQRQPVGSQTAFNTQIQKWLEQGNLPTQFMAEAGSPSGYLSLAKRAYQHIMFNRNTGELARIFTQGSVDDLRAILQSGRRSFQGQAAMTAAIARQAAATDPQSRQQQP